MIGGQPPPLRLHPNSRTRYLSPVGGLPMAKQILSYACLGAGVLGLILPVIPGIPLLILGFGLLDQRSWLRRRAGSLIHRFGKRTRV